jgi:hypothetical protein
VSVLLAACGKELQYFRTADAKSILFPELAADLTGARYPKGAKKMKGGKKIYVIQR